jgi:hypothetical protein
MKTSRRRKDKTKNKSIEEELRNVESARKEVERKSEK